MRVYDFFKIIHDDLVKQEDFIIAYVAQDCESYRFPKEPEDRVQYILQSREFVQETLEKLMNSPIKESEDVACVFKEYNDLEEYENKYRYGSSILEYNEMMSVDADNVVIHDFGNKNNVQTYCYMFVDIPEILGYQMSDFSIEAYGWLNCALAIFYEICFNGISEESREERKEELKESSRYYEENKDNPDAFISGDEMISRLREMIYEDMDADEEAYYRIKEKYDDMAEEELRPYKKKYYDWCHRQFIEDNFSIIKKEIQKVHMK